MYKDIRYNCKITRGMPHSAWSAAHPLTLTTISAYVCEKENLIISLYSKSSCTVILLEKIKSIFKCCEGRFMNYSFEWKVLSTTNLCSTFWLDVGWMKAFKFKSYIMGVDTFCLAGPHAIIQFIYSYLHSLKTEMSKIISVSKEYYAHFSTWFQSIIDSYKIFHFR